MFYARVDVLCTHQHLLRWVWQSLLFLRVPTELWCDGESVRTLLFFFFFYDSQ
jgi:hypothetical protein